MLQDVGVSSQEGKSFSDSSAIEKSKQNNWASLEAQW